MRNMQKSMKTQNLQPRPKDPLYTQLRRIRGQLDGVIRMYEDEKSCVDIVRQVLAVRNSLSRVARGLLTEEASRCTRQRKIEELDSFLKEMFRY